MTTTASVPRIVSDTRTLTKSLGAQTALKELAEPAKFGELKKVAIDRAARRAGMTYSRAFEIWYGRARRIEQFEADALAEALDKKRREDARNELYEIQVRIARLEARLASTDPDFHRPLLDGLGQAKIARG